MLSGARRRRSEARHSPSREALTAVFCLERNTHAPSNHEVSSRIITKGGEGSGQQQNAAASGGGETESMVTTAGGGETESMVTTAGGGETESMVMTASVELDGGAVEGWPTSSDVGDGPDVASPLVGDEQAVPADEGTSGGEAAAVGVASQVRRSTRPRGLCTPTTGMR